MKIASVALILPLTAAFQPLGRFGQAPGNREKFAIGSFLSSSDDYLSTLSTIKLPETTWEMPKHQAPFIIEESVIGDTMVTFSHAPRSFFAVETMTPSGPRKNADVGKPHDASRPLVEVGATSAGSWWCAAGGWPSPAQRTTTEIFFVFSGRGCLTDLDGMRHEFGPGDTVILPKGWSGRWDVLEDVHKVWVVYDHPRIEETSNPIRAVVTPYSTLMNPRGEHRDVMHNSPSTVSQTIYKVGPTKVGSSMINPCSLSVYNRPTTECFHVLEGLFFLTNKDGSARRCLAGDTLVLPKGWTGHWDVIEPVKRLWVVVE